MKLLFDQNISFRLVKHIRDIFPEAKQVRELGLENVADIQIFNFAKNNNYAIVTFDADFCDLSVLKGYPPKIIWLKIGNTTTRKLEEVFRNHFQLINLFEFEDKACLVITD